MEVQNLTLVTELTLLGFSKDLSTNIILFAIFLLMYLVCINANCLIFYLVLSNSILHIPMYYFLCILSVIDLSITSSILPKLLADLISSQRIISLAACKFQVYIFLLLGGTEGFLLTLMAYDRYVAICRPLHYPILMRWSNCYRMTASAWIISFILYVAPYIYNSPTCYPNQVNHFMCDGVVVKQPACENTRLSELSILTSIVSFLLLFLNFVLIIVSYICILSSVIKIKSAGRSKAFSTCSSHVIVVALYYGPTFAMVFVAASNYSTSYEKYFSLLTCVICPTLNPLIYCLNNKDIKEAQRKKFHKFGRFFPIKNK